MSSRQMKKLRAQEEQRNSIAQPEDGGHSSSEEDEEIVVDKPRAKNVFAAFAALGEDDDGHDNDDDEDGEDGEAEPTPPSPLPSASTKASKKKKKAKKKAKGVKAGAKTETAEGGSALPPAAALQKQKAKQKDDELDEIDRALRELNMQKRAASPPHHGSADKTDKVEGRDPGRIQINLSDLRVLNELRDVFGRDTVRAARADEANNGGLMQPDRTDGNPGMVMVDLETFLRGTPPMPPPGAGGGGRRAAAIMASAAAAAARKGMADAVARRNPFIEFKDTWPRAPSGGLGMRQITPVAGEDANRVVEYTFMHSPSYVKLDDVFFSLVMMHDPHPLIQFLKQNPYHIASLIQISRVAKQDQNAALAADLCERALFSFGRSTLSSFRQKLGEGLARLSFRRPENRQFLLAGYYYIKSLIPRGTHRTALAWVKLFLSLMPDDEYGLLLWGHALAVRAGDDQWLVDVCGDETQGDGDRLLALRNNPMRDYIRQSAVVARLDLGDTAGARAALERGMARLPWLYVALFQALSLDVPRAIWGAQPRNHTETLYTQLYVQLAKDLWEPAPVTSLLREVAAAATGSGPGANYDHLPRAPPVSPSIARFVYLDGTPATMALVPSEMLHRTPNYDFDPLPPAREDNVFSNKSQERPWIVADNENNEIEDMLRQDEEALQRLAERRRELDAQFEHDEEIVRRALALGREGMELTEEELHGPLEYDYDLYDDPRFNHGDVDDYDDEDDDDDDHYGGRLLMRPREEDGRLTEPTEDDWVETSQPQTSQTTHDHYHRQRTGGMPGAWVEDVEDEED